MRGPASFALVTMCSYQGSNCPISRSHQPGGQSKANPIANSDATLPDPDAEGWELAHGNMGRSGMTPPPGWTRNRR
jgi:hypothetical protein